MTEATYDYDALPKKRMAAGALLLNEQGQILIVKPTYRSDRLLPKALLQQRLRDGSGDCLKQFLAFLRSCRPRLADHTD